jgi:hypothetical protein
VSPLDKIAATAPDHIWLDLGEEAHLVEEGTTFKDLGGVTWSEDNATGQGIKYVRALASHTGEAEPVGWQHVANEWADMATSAIQALRNIIAGFEKPSAVLANLNFCYSHCAAVQARAEHSTPARPVVTDAQIAQWAERHDIHGGLEELRAMVGDARTLENAAVATPSAATPAAPGEVEPASQEQARVMANIRKSLDAVYANLKDRDCLGATLAMEGVLKTIDALSNPAPVAAPALASMVVTEDMHVAAVKVLQRASGLDGLPQRMLDAMLAVVPPVAPAPASEAVAVGRVVFYPRQLAPGVDWLSNVGIRNGATLYTVPPRPAGDSADAPVQQAGELETVANWIAEQWHAEVANRPLVNVHRKRLDDKWRQLLERLHVDHRARLGPTHDELTGEQPVEPSGTERGEV